MSVVVAKGVPGARFESAYTHWLMARGIWGVVRLLDCGKVPRWETSNKLAFSPLAFPGSFVIFRHVEWSTFIQ